MQRSPSPAESTRSNCAYDEVDYENLPVLANIRLKDKKTVYRIMTRNYLTIDARAKLLEDHMTITEQKEAKKWMQDYMSNFFTYLSLEDQGICQLFIDSNDWDNLRTTVYAEANDRPQDGDQILTAFNHWLQFRGIVNDSVPDEQAKNIPPPAAAASAPVSHTVVTVEPKPQPPPAPADNTPVNSGIARRSGGGIVERNVSNNELLKKLNNIQDETLGAILARLEQLEKGQEGINQLIGDEIKELKTRVETLNEEKHDLLKRLEANKHKYEQNLRSNEEAKEAEFQARLQEMKGYNNGTTSDD